MDNDTYRIYQIKRALPGDGGYDLRRDISFAGMDSLTRRGLQVDPANYELVYTGRLEDWMTPELLFEKFNIDIPPDFYGHSMSVSDVIVFVRDGKETAYFCDSARFARLDKFITPESPPRRPARRKRPKGNGGAR